MQLLSRVVRGMAQETRYGWCHWTLSRSAAIKRCRHQGHSAPRVQMQQYVSRLFRIIHHFTHSSTSGVHIRVAANTDTHTHTHAHTCQYAQLYRRAFRPIAQRSVKLECRECRGRQYPMKPIRVLHANSNVCTASLAINVRIN